VLTNFQCELYYVGDWDKTVIRENNTKGICIASKFSSYVKLKEKTFIELIFKYVFGCSKKKKNI